ncbi:MAG: hypothetical protein H6918_09830 [Sphingomonadaceae bacterium]|nr:hypothetical protein [Sphingomonadaceae bacterium]
MFTAIVKYQLPGPVPRDAMLAAFKAAEDRFAGVPGLVRKYFAYDEAAHCGHSVYLWECEEQARTFFDESFVQAMQDKFGATPEWYGVDTLLVVDGPAT